MPASQKVDAPKAYVVPVAGVAFARVAKPYNQVHDPLRNPGFLTAIAIVTSFLLRTLRIGALQQLQELLFIQHPGSQLAGAIEL